MKNHLVITIHGWNSAGEYMRYANSPLRAAGLRVYNYNYGWLIAKTLKNSGIVDRVVDLINFLAAETHFQSFILLGHSNGCELSWRIARRTPRVIGLSLHNAALDANVVFPSSLNWVHNWYTPSDSAVKFGSWLPWNKWGDLGAKAYQGPSAMVRSIDKGQGLAAGGGESVISVSHSDTFRDPIVRAVFLPATASAIVRAIEAP